MADPLRQTARPAISQCLAAGIRVIMITGDYPATALSIAEQCGLDVSAGVLTGEDIDALEEVQLQQRLRQATVFCRVQPEQKLRLVQTLKNAGEIVAMTGDDVNDAPALKAEHIGIAMGGRGTDVARESAALVLLDDDFGSIVAAVRLGRRIVDNIRKAVVFVVATLWSGLAEQQARALTFSAMIIGDIWLIFINRSWSLPLVKSISLPNPALWWVVACGLMMLALALFLPFMNTLFHFERPPLGYLALTIVAVSISLLLIATFTRGQKQSKKH
ncbi:cation-translocating P-type ATPase [Rheinheimera baltica]|nr:cation-translocating P-type ATPase [Rheinheimera baltica]MDP5150518.1 cation-translocating P-type ATPase [Rheinheimera baltica]